MKKFYNIILVCTALLWGFCGSAWGASPLLVASGSSTSNYVPISGNYCDEVGTKTQVIYPSSLLTEMEGKEITGLKFYSSQSSVSYSGVVIKIRLAEVNVTTLSGFLSPDFTEVYSGGFAISSYEMNFTLSEAYLYGGGNLLLETEVVTAGSFNFPYFYGISQTSAAYGNKVSYGSAGVSSFLPKTSFTYATPAVVACPKPKSLAGDAASSSSATITWKKGGSETAWDLQYSDNDFSTYTELNLTTSNVSVDGSGNCSYTLSGLSAQTTYKVKVRANCGGGDGESDYTSAVSFTTLCGAITSFPWTENFEGGTANTLLNCWDNSASTTSDVSGSNSYYVWGVHSYGGNKMLRMNNYWVHTGTAVVNTPTIDLPSAPKLTFKYAHNASCGTFYVKISTNNGVSFSNIGSYSKGSNSDRDNPVSFTTATINLSTYANQSVIIQFYASANYGSGAIFIDDVHIESTQDCSKPSTPVASDITGNSAHISWTAKTGVTSYKYIYKTSSTEPTSSDWESASTTSYTYVDLAGLTDGTTYYFWVMCACGTVASDACSFTPLSCPTVTGVTLSNKVHNGVRVNWATSSATNCDVRYKAGAGAWNSAGTDISAAYKDISGLTVGTTYTFEVKPSCSADGWVAAGETYTPTCPTPGALSLSGKKFNGVTISWSAVTGVSSYNLRYRKGSDSWTTVNDIAALTYTISSGLVTGEEYTIELQSECGGSYSSTTYTPEASDPAVVSVGSITEISATASWTDMSGEGAIGYQYILVARDAAVNWAGATSVGAGTFSASLTGLTVGTDYDVYVRTKYSASLYSTGKKRQFTTKVEKPTGLTQVTVTSNSAQFSWTAGGNATQYQILCLPSATTPTDSHWESSTLVSTTSGTATGLSPLTSYKFYVRAYHNGKVSVKVTSSEFTTPCGAVSADGWSEDFESATAGYGLLPECWASVQYSYYNYDYYETRTYPYVYNSSYYARNSNKSLYFYGGVTGTSDQIAILPLFTEDMNTMTMSFYYNHTDYYTSASYGQLILGYYKNSAFTQIKALTRKSSYYNEIIDLAVSNTGVDIPADACIAIKFTGGSSIGCAWVDDISFSKTPTCYAPSGLSRTALTHNSASFSWTASGHGESTYQWAVAEGNAAPVWVDDAAHKVSTKSVTVTGLTTGTSYKFYVRSYCAADDQSTHLVSAAFTPTCIAPTSISKSNLRYNGVTITWSTGGVGPWSIDYSTDGGSNWTSAATGLASRSYTFDATHHPMTPSTTYTIKITNECGASATTTYTPTCPTPSGLTKSAATYNGVTVSWNSATGISTYNLKYYITANGEGTATTVNDIAGTSYSISGLTTGSAYTIKVQTECGGSWASTTYTPQYPTPSGLTVSSITVNSASASWTAAAESPTGYEYVLMEGTASANWSNATSTASCSVSLTSLKDGQPYKLYVRAKFGEGRSSAVSTTFTTLTIAPSGLSVDAVTESGGSFSWSNTGLATKYQWKVGSGDWSSAISTSSVTVTGLDAEQTYTFYVRSYYSASVQSDAVSTNFTTAACSTRSMPFSENFNAWTTSSRSACWRCIDDRWGSGNGCWYWDEDRHVRYKQTNGNITEASLETPPIYLSEPAELSFKYSNYFSYHAVRSYVVISNGTITKEVELETTSSSTLDDRYQKAPINLSNVDGADFTGSTITIRFKGTTCANSTGYFCLDDVKVESSIWIFQTSGNWNTKSCWNKGTAQNRLPTIEHEVIIRRPVTVPASTKAVAKKVTIDQSGSYTGRIVIADRGELIIANTLRKTTDGSSLIATTVNDVTLSTSASGNGVLAIGNHDGSNHATIGFYTKAYKDETDGYINQFIGQPVNGADNFSNFYGSYLYKFDAAKGWVNQKSGSTSEAFAGYNVLRKDAAPTTMVIQGSLVSSANHVCNLYYNGSSNTENMIGNSWMAPIDIASMGANEAAAFVNCDATVYIYNSGSRSQQEAAGAGAADATTPGQYIVLPVKTISMIDPATTVIPPMQAFSVYATADEASLTLNYETMVLNPVKSMSNATATTATKVQRRERMEAEQPEIMKLRVTNENGTSDIVYMLMRDDWTTGFENGYDGRKMYGNSSNPQLYAKSEAGEMAVNCVADAEGTLIGLKPGNNNNLTFTFSYDGDRTLYLNDLKEQKSTLINDENSYMFFMDADEAAERFIISSTPFGAPEVATGTGSGERLEVSGARKVIYNEKMYILYNGRIYSADGAIVK